MQAPIDVLRSATVVAADLLDLTGEVGTLAVGAHADLLVLDGDPLEDIGVLAEPGRIRHVVQAGEVRR